MKESTKKTFAEFLRAVLASIVSLITALTVGSCQIYQNPIKEKAPVESVSVDANVHYPN